MTFLLILLLGLWTLPAWAATYYVSGDSGNDGNGCMTATDASDMTHARQTINEGLKCLSAGDTLYVRAGLYPELLNSEVPPFTTWTSGTSWDNPVTVAGYPGETVIVRPGAGSEHLLNIHDPGSIPDTSYREYIIIDNFTIDASNLHSNAIPVRFAPGARRIRIQHCVIIGNANSNGVGWASDLASSPTAIGRETQVYYNEIKDNGGYGIYMGSMDNVIDGNYIHHNHGYGIHGYSADNASSARNIVRNNYVTNNGIDNPNPSGSCALIIGSGDGNVAYNNIIDNHNDPNFNCGLGVNNGGNGKVYNNTIVNVPGACLYNNESAGNSKIYGNLCYNNNDGEVTFRGDTDFQNNHPNSVNPLFMNCGVASRWFPGGSPFCLSEASPARAITSVIAGVESDIQGSFRGNPGDPTDAGAYMYGSVATTCPPDCPIEPVLGTYYLAPVASGGNDVNTCEAARTGTPSPTPKATFASVLPCMAPGSTLYLRAGTYTDSLITSVAPLPGGADAETITRIAAYGCGTSPETVTLKSSGGSVVVWLDAGPTTDKFLTFDCLNLDGDNVPGMYALGIVNGAHHITWKNSTILETPGSGIYAGSVSNVHITATTLHDVGASDVPGLWLQGVTTAMLGHLTLYNTVGAAVSIDTASSGVTLEQSTLRNAGGSGLVVAGSTAAAQNNLIYSNALRGIDVQTGSSDVTLYYNTLWSNTGAPIQIDSGATATTYRGNIFTANGNGNAVSNAGTSTVGTNNFAGDPGFVAPGPPTTFHVSSASVVGQGPTIPSVSVDFGGNGRTVPYTIGAWEDEVTPPTPTVVRVPPYGTTPFVLMQ